MSAIRPDAFAFNYYLHRQDKTAAARAEVSAASRKLELSQIHERLAELKSQHEPLAKMIEELRAHGDLDRDRLREALYASAFYVVAGRMP